MKRYTSNVKWPESVSVGANEDNVSTDIHDTRAVASYVCEWLIQHGFGGEGKIFPIDAWVGEVETEPSKIQLLVWGLSDKDEEFYGKFSTERLLNVFRKLHVVIMRSDYDGYGNEECIKLQRDYNILKSVLDKREHVFNKNERRRMLKKKAK